MRFAVLAPMALAIVAFILSMLCLFAGNKPGFLEEYNIITLNTSTLGYNLIPDINGEEPTDTVLPDFLDGLIDDAADKTTDTLNKIGNKIADELADQLGIHEWYSLHVMDMCFGTFRPNATAKGASKNGTRCTTDIAMNNFDITALLEKELEDGPANITLADIKWPDAIQNGLDGLNTAFDAAFILYCIGIGAAGLSILTSLISPFIDRRIFSLANGALAGLSFFCLLITSIIITIVQNKATGLINKHGNDIGLYAYKGQKFLILTWVAVAAMFVSLVLWAALFCVGRKKEKREYTEKRAGGRGGFGGWRARRSDEHALRRSGV